MRTLAKCTTSGCTRQLEACCRPIAVAVILVVSLGQLPGQLPRKWSHPQAAAINVASWLGLRTGGLLWPLALIWAFLARAPIADQKSLP